MTQVTAGETASTQIEVEYFAILREHAGTVHERVTTSASTPAALFDELDARYAFPLGRDALRVAVNDDFVDWEARIAPGDRVAFIPPVAGG